MKTFVDMLKEKVSTRAAYGIVVLILILGMVAMGTVREHVEQVRTDTEFAARELAKINTIENSDLWAKRAQVSHDALNKWQQTKWQGETVGVVAAKIQQKLIQLAEKLNMDSPQINVGNELIDFGGEIIMRFSISGASADSEAPIELLLALAENDKTIIIENVVADFYQGQRSMIRLSGMALVSISSNPGVQGTGK